MLGQDSAHWQDQDQIRSFPAPVDGELLAWCPTMNLLALAAADGKSIAVYRKNGLNIWEASPANTFITGFSWRLDGRLLCAVTSQGQALVYDSNSGRLICTVPSTAGTIATGLVDWIPLHALESLDMGALKHLPRLPGCKLEQNSIESLLLFGSTTVNVALHGLFPLGHVQIISNDNEEDDVEIIGHAALNEVTHYVLTLTNSTVYTIRKFDLLFSSHSAWIQNMSLLSSKIIAIMAYVDETLILVNQEIRTYLDFNNRVLDILQNDLKKKDETIEDQLDNLLLTGMMTDEVKDWFENTIGDRGLKKWTKLGETAFDNTRRILSTNLIPACERLIIYLSNLSACSKTFSEMNDVEIVNDEAFSRSLLAVKSMMTLLFESIIKMNTEQEFFKAFITWVQLVLKNLAEDDEKDLSYKTSEVFDFVNSHLQRSVLLMLTPNLRRHFNNIKITTTDIFDLLKTYMRTLVLADQDFRLPLDIPLTRKQVIKFIENDLFVLSFNADNLYISKIDISKSSVKTSTINFGYVISDIHLSAASSELFILSNNCLWSYHIDQSGDDGAISKSSLSPSEPRIFEGFTPQVLAINEQRKVGCLIAQDLQHYMIFEL